MLSPPPCRASYRRNAPNTKLGRDERIPVFQSRDVCLIKSEICIISSRFLGNKLAPNYITADYIYVQLTLEAENADEIRMCAG